MTEKDVKSTKNKQIATQIDNKVGEMKYMKVSDLEEFQGNLKKPNDEKINDLKRRIKHKGFSAPLFIWAGHNFILDGHQRLKAVAILKDEGYTFDKDMIPVIEIHASSKSEAKERVLEYNSKFSEVDRGGLEDFMGDDLDMTDIDDLDLGIWMGGDDDKEEEDYGDKGPGRDDKLFIDVTSSEKKLIIRAINKKRKLDGDDQLDRGLVLAEICELYLDSVM